MLVRSKADNRMKPAFRIHSLKRGRGGTGFAFSSLVAFLFVFFMTQQIFSRGAENLPRGDARKQVRRDVHIIHVHVAEYKGPALPFRLMKVLSLANFTLNIEPGKLI